MLKKSFKASFYYYQILYVARVIHKIMVLLIT